MEIAIHTDLDGLTLSLCTSNGNLGLATRNLSCALSFAFANRDPTATTFDFRNRTGFNDDLKNNLLNGTLELEVTVQSSQLRFRCLLRGSRQDRS